MSDTSHTSLFVYGTLLVPKIWNAVTDCSDLTSKPASLAGHRIAKVRGGDFPVITQDPSAKRPVPGRVIFSVPKTAIQRLDAYEDGFYERDRVSILCERQKIEAEVYRVPIPLVPRLFSDDPWTLEWFEANALDEYWNYHFGS
ncbi:MAG: gamma-glutamylcyclotransferase [Verrucomicrobiales bacterium]|nr:gamma-glutamylcyclotransferase [Verrucomicrobiales bacterium]